VSNLRCPVALCQHAAIFQAVAALHASFTRESRRLGARHFSTPYKHDSLARVPWLNLENGDCMRNVAVSSVLLAVALSACGGGGDGGGTQPPPPAVFTSLAIAPTSPDLVFRDTLQMTATPRDQNGAPMTVVGTATFERVSGTAVSVSTSGRVIADAPGSAQIRASLTSGTTTHTATANATVRPLGTTADVTVSGAGQSFSPDTVKIAVDGTVTWTFSAGANAPHNVTFATAHPQGNIGNTTTGSATRTFATAGRFPYQCTLHAGMSGAVVVRTP
jgi:plastocyanin